MHLQASLFCSLSLLNIFTHAQHQFTNPDGTARDLSQGYVTGSTISIDYKKGWFGIGTKQAFVDLYVTSFEDGAFSTLIAQNISLDTDGSTRWTIDISETQVKANNKYVFRLVQARIKPDYNGAASVGMSPSRGFVLKLPSASSTVIASASTSLSLSATSLTSLPMSSSGPGTDGTKEEKKSTPVGAIVGGTIGGVALLALGVAAFFFLRRRKNKTSDAEYHQPPMASHSYTDQGAVPPKYKDVASHQDLPPQELHDNAQIHEADSDYAQSRR